MTGERSVIRRMYFKAIWPTAPRDMIANTTWEEHYPFNDIKHNPLRKYSNNQLVSPAQEGNTNTTNTNTTSGGNEDKDNDPEKSKLSQKSSLFIASRSPLGSESHIGEISGYVRGYIPVSGYWLQPVPSGAPLLGLDPNSADDSGEIDENAPFTDVRLTLTAHTELGGSLPTSVINMLSCSAPVKVLSAIKEIIRRQGNN